MGDPSAREAVYQSAFARLQAIASALLSRETSPPLLPSELVSELFLKLHRLKTPLVSEDHFFRISTRAMRQILIDESRLRKSPIRHRVCQSRSEPESALAVKATFEKLHSLDPRAADTVWQRSVEGATVAELSRQQDREPWRVRADYAFGIEWMANRLKRSRV